MGEPVNKSVKPVLKQRWITAAALVPAAIVVVQLPTWLFASAIAGVVLLASKEWLQLRPIGEDVIRRNVLLAAAGLFVLYWFAHVDTVVVVSMLIAAGSWFMRALRLVNAPRSPESEAQTREDAGADNQASADSQAKAYNQAKVYAESNAQVLASAALNGRQHLLKGAALLAFPFLALVALHADAKGLLAHGEGLADAMALALDDHALEHLGPAALALDDLEVDADAITRLELGHAAQLRALKGFDDAAHGSAQRNARAGAPRRGRQW